MKCEIEDYYNTRLQKTCYRLRYRGFCIDVAPLLGGHVGTIHLQSAMRKLEVAYEESMEAKKFTTPYRCDKE